MYLIRQSLTSKEQFGKTLKKKADSKKNQVFIQIKEQPRASVFKDYATISN